MPRGKPKQCPNCGYQTPIGMREGSQMSKVVEFVRQADGPISFMDIVNANLCPPLNVSVYLHDAVKGGVLARPARGMYEAAS